MEYTIYELLFFLFFYSFLGWCVEVAYMAIKTGRFCNRGYLNLPMGLSYGIAMDLLLLILPTLRGRYWIQALACLIITSACVQIASEVSDHLTGKHLWEQEKISLYSGKLKGLVQAGVFSVLAVLVILLIHPVVFLVTQMIPYWLLKVTALGILFLMLADFSVVSYTVRKKPLRGGVQNLSKELEEQKKNFGTRLSEHIWVRLKKAYPNLRAADEELLRDEKKDVFARGICLDKIIWVFFISALGGDLIETVYVGLVSGVWMSRSSVLYGTFSIVWGIGAALLTLILHRLADREDRYIFLGGFFLGGAYEYLCSVFTEVFFGTTFWDYSDMPFNIGGRTNLLFCVFWGALALVWVKFCYPHLSCWIEKIPPLTGKILTWVCVVLMACDMLISAIAMVRYVERAEGIPAGNTVEEFIDYEYPDEFIEFIWPNLRIE